MVADTSKTKNFINTYLVPGGTGKGYGFYQMVAATKGTDKRSIIGKLRGMNYHDFLMTRYWQLTALKVKCDAGWRCAKCGRRSGLVVHHLDYACRGVEMYHLDRLVCLCKDCHEDMHGMKKASK